MQITAKWKGELCFDLGDMRDPEEAARKWDLVKRITHAYVESFAIAPRYEPCPCNALQSSGANDE